MTSSVHLHIWKPALSTHSDPLSMHPPHQLASGRMMVLAPCGTSHVLWQVINIIFNSFKHVVFEILLIIEHMLGDYSFEPVSPW